MHLIHLTYWLPHLSIITVAMGCPSLWSQLPSILEMIGYIWPALWKFHIPNLKCIRFLVNTHCFDNIINPKNHKPEYHIPKIVSFVVVLKTGSCVCQAGLKFTIKQRMTLNLWSFFSTFQVLELQIDTTKSGLHCNRYETQGFLHTQQTLYQLRYILSILLRKIQCCSWNLSPY